MSHDQFKLSVAPESKLRHMKLYLPPGEDSKYQIQLKSILVALKVVID